MGGLAVLVVLALAGVVYAMPELIWRPSSIAKCVDGLYACGERTRRKPLINLIFVVFL